MDVTSAQSKATYEEIKDYVLGKQGLQDTKLQIAQGKRKCAMIARENVKIDGQAGYRPYTEIRKQSILCG